MNHSPILILGATGKTGRRIVRRLSEKGHAVRKGSRQSDPPFDWGDQGTWDAVLDDVTAAYISYSPDLAIPGATEAIRAFVERAVEHGARLHHSTSTNGNGNNRGYNEKLIKSLDN